MCHLQLLVTTCRAYPLTVNPDQGSLVVTICVTGWLHGAPEVVLGRHWLYSSTTQVCVATSRIVTPVARTVCSARLASLSSVMRPKNEAARLGAKLSPAYLPPDEFSRISSGSKASCASDATPQARTNEMVMHSFHLLLPMSVNRVAL